MQIIMPCDRGVWRPCPPCAADASTSVLPWPLAGRRVPVVRITGNLVNVRGQGHIRRSGKTAAATRTIPCRSSSSRCSASAGPDGQPTRRMGINHAERRVPYQWRTRMRMRCHGACCKRRRSFRTSRVVNTRSAPGSRTVRKAPDSEPRALY